MKKMILVISTALSSFSFTKLQGQSPGDYVFTSPVGIFDTLFDKLGTKYGILDLDVQSAKALGGTGLANSTPTVTCQAGYFTLYFAPGSIFISSASAQTVICKVF